MFAQAIKLSDSSVSSGAAGCDSCQWSGFNIFNDKYAADSAWVFDWAGTTMSVPIVRFLREAKTIVTGRTSSQPLVLTNGAVLPKVEGSPVTIQRRKNNGKWQTIATKRSKVLGLVMYTDKKTPKDKKLRYRLFVPGAPDFTLTVIART